MLSSPHHVEVGQEIPPLSKLVTLEVSQAYSGWPERRNFHTDEGIARRLGFPSLVMQGVLGPAYVSELCLRFFGQGWLQGGRLDMRFLKPVLAPQRLTIRGVVRDKTLEETLVRLHLDVWIENEAGEPVQRGTASGLLLT
jgi:acyl dehydratase